MTTDGVDQMLRHGFVQQRIQTRRELRAGLPKTLNDSLTLGVILQLLLDLLCHLRVQLPVGIGHELLDIVGFHDRLSVMVARCGCSANEPPAHSRASGSRRSCTVGLHGMSRVTWLPAGRTSLTLDAGAEPLRALVAALGCPALVTYKAKGVVADADLADAGLIFGAGFAPYTGGPLHYHAVSAMQHQSRT